MLGRFVLLHIFFLLLAQHSRAAPPVLTYQGRILNSEKQPLEYFAVAFEFVITSDDGTCVFYKEQRNNIDMRNSGGVFDIPIGSGIRSYPNTPGFTILNAFKNGEDLICEGGSVYKPAIHEGRRLRVSFHDGETWRLIRPDVTVRSVPYASFAMNSVSASMLGTKRESDFVLKNTLPVACSGTEVLSFDGTNFLCVEPTSSAVGIAGLVGDVTASGSGSVTATIASNAVNNSKLANDAVTSAKILDGTIVGADLDFGGANSSSTNFVMKDSSGKFYNFGCSTTDHVPMWTASGFICQSVLTTESDPKIGSTTENMLSKWNGAMLVDSAVYENSGNVGIGTATPTQKLEVAGKVKATELCIGTDCRATWPATGGNGTVTEIIAGTGLTGGTISTSGTIGLGIELEGVSALNTTGFVKRTAAGAYSTSAILDISTDTTGTLPITRGGTGATDQAGAINALLPAQTGQANKFLQTNGTGVSWADVPVAGLTSLSGDVSATGPGATTATISSNAVTNTKIADGAVTSSKILDGTIVGADMDFGGLNSATTSFVMKDSTGKFYNFGCSTTGHVPTWTVGGFSCQPVLTTEVDPKIGANALNVLSKWDSSKLVASAIYENTGNVGIGTINPIQSLHIASKDGEEGNPGIFIQDPTTGNNYGASLTYDDRDGLNGLKLTTISNGVENAYVFINRITGRVGIGTTAPSTAFHVNRDATTTTAVATLETTGASGRPFLDFKAEGSSYGWVGFGSTGIDSMGMVNYQNGSLSLGTNSLVRMTILGNGNVGVGTANTNAAFHIVTGNINEGLVVDTDSDAADHMLKVRGTGNGGVGVTDADTKFIVLGNGHVGIGTSTPTYQLQLSTDSAAKPGTSTWTVASDERLKDIHGPFTRGLEALLGLKTIYFNYKNDNNLGLPSDKEYVGIKAQDVKKVIPEAITEDENGFLHVTNDSIIWTAVNAIKELYGKLSGQQRELASVNLRAAQLEAQNFAKDQEIAQLKKRATSAEEKIKILEKKFERLEKSLSSK